MVFEIIVISGVLRNVSKADNLLLVDGRLKHEILA